MYTLNNYAGNPNVAELAQLGAFQVLEYRQDLSVSPQTAQIAYFVKEMNIRQRQVICDLAISPVTVQAGAMQWMLGDVNCTTGIKGVGDLIGKAFKGSVSGESAIKPEYVGKGLMALEPTYKHILLEDLSQWNGSIVVEDGMFFACESGVKQTIVARSNVSSAVLGGEGLFNLALNGKGIVCLESPIPREELIEVILEDDVMKIDGNMAVAWSSSLKFTVERSGKTLIGSAASGEGLVNVYRGTGKILFSPVATTYAPIL